MGWNSFHNRGQILRAVVDAANERCDGVLPTDLPGVSENFADDLDLVGALQLKWHARLSGNIERAFVTEPLDLESAVIGAWRETATQLRGVRLVLDAHATRRATHLERARLATAAGLASSQSDAAAAVGWGIEERARQAFAAPGPAPLAPRRIAFADRLRAALAA